MSIADWLIVIIPTALVVAIGLWSRKYVRSVVDFLSAGRIAGRYVLTAGDAANALAIIGIIAYVEVQYKTGFALVFWNYATLPLTIIIGLYGFCTYRFRETKAMSLGQFLEMRYNRPFRIFASCLRSLSEMLANMIMPAVAARFFIYFLDLPHSFSVYGVEISTFSVIIIICLAVAILIICCGGTLALLITDAFQGMLLFPLMVVFVIFILVKFDWATQIVPTLGDRVPGESFLNSFDISNFRDFNVLMIILMVVNSIVHRASWIGAGYSTAAKTPHEQKMAGILGTWRGALNGLFYALIALAIITTLNHADFAGTGKEIRDELSSHIIQETVAKEHRADFMERISSIPEQHHIIGKDAPLSQKKNLDTPLLDT
jgi:Na+/proline symporter